jgi:hypothetical protein
MKLYRRKLQRGEKPLSHYEKRFMLCAERGDCATVSKMIEMYRYSGATHGDIQVQWRYRYT